VDEIGFGLVALILLLLGGKKKNGDEPTKMVLDPSAVPGRPVPGQVVIDPDALPDVTPDKPGKDKGPPLPEIVDDYPTPASFYQVRSGDTGYGIAYKMLKTAGFLAAQKFGDLDDAAANAFGKMVAKKISFQKQVWKGISCAGFNDATVTTYGWKGSSQPLAPTGRVVRLLPQHVDNLRELAAGRPALRNMRWGNPGMKGKGGGTGVDGSYRSFETLWLPGVNLKKLWESDGNVFEWGGGEWGNSGVSKMYPPPWVLDLGVDWLPGAEPPTRDFGCGDLGMEL
jgi:hypothetical protein